MIFPRQFIKTMVAGSLLAISLQSLSAKAGTIELLDRSYTPADLHALVTPNTTSTSLTSTFLQINPGDFREIVVQDGLTSAGALAGFESVRFDFSYDFAAGSFGSPNSSDKDSFVGIHDGTHHLSIFNNETSNLNVFGDVIVGGPGGGLGIGFPPNPPNSVRDTPISNLGGQSQFSASILMDATGLAVLEVHGQQSTAMQLDITGPFSFFIGTDEADETYRIEGASITVTATTVPTPASILLLLIGALMIYRKKVA